MTKKINKITPQQKAKLRYYRDKWLAIGLDTTPGDKVIAERALRACYRATGLSEPKQVIFAESPLSGALIVASLNRKCSGDSVGDSVRDSVRSSVWASVWASVWESVWKSVGASVGASVRASVRASVWDSVGASVLYTQHDAGFQGFCDFFRTECGLIEETRGIIDFMELSQHSCWVYLYQNIAVIADKPKLISMKNGRIHSEIGPAVEYRDGFSVYGLDGIRITKEIFENVRDKKSAKEIMAISNAEQRLVAIKYFGAGNMIKELDGKCIDEKGSEYKLWNVTIEGSNERLLQMQNQSEAKTHYEFVEPECETVNQALLCRLGLNLKTNYREPVAKT